MQLHKNVIKPMVGGSEILAGGGRWKGRMPAGGALGIQREREREKVPQALRAEDIALPSVRALRAKEFSI